MTRYLCRLLLFALWLVVSSMVVGASIEQAGALAGLLAAAVAVAWLWIGREALA